MVIATPNAHTPNAERRTPTRRLTSSLAARKANSMGKQLNKVEKRRRRRDYLQRKKNAAKAAKQ
jgi:hypothetical protein